jgi:hypothetical protein
VPLVINVVSLLFFDLTSEAEKESNEVAFGPTVAWSPDSWFGKLPLEKEFVSSTKLAANVVKFPIWDSMGQES